MCTCTALPSEDTVGSDERKCSSVNTWGWWRRWYIGLSLIGCRNRSSHDPRYKPRHGHVLGNITLEPDGDNGETLNNQIFTLIVNHQPCERIWGSCERIHPWFLCPTNVASLSLFQEAYSVARQFNQIPPICEQAEYHMFQREKVEVQLPELFHKIGVHELLPDLVQSPEVHSNDWHVHYISLSPLQSNWSWTVHRLFCSHSWQNLYQSLAFNGHHSLLSSGVGAMTWSPLACGIISGKYDGRVPPYSRASLKVDKPRSLVFPVALPPWSPPRRRHRKLPLCSLKGVCSLCVCVLRAHTSCLRVCVLCRADTVRCVSVPQQHCLPAGFSLSHILHMVKHASTLLPYTLQDQGCWLHFDGTQQILNRLWRPMTPWGAGNVRGDVMWCNHVSM